MEGGVKRKRPSHHNVKGKGKGIFGSPNPNPKKDVSDIPPMNEPIDTICYYYHEMGH